MPALHQFDPGLTSVSWNGLRIYGYSDDMITAVHDEDQWTDAAGPNGDVVRVRNRNQLGDVTITLQAESPVNDLLSAAMLVDKASGVGYGALEVVNINSTTLVKANKAWIKKMPEIGISKDAGTRVWVLRCADLDIYAGGAIV